MFLRNTTMLSKANFWKDVHTVLPKKILTLIKYEGISSIDCHYTDIMDLSFCHLSVKFIYSNNGFYSIDNSLKACYKTPDHSKKNKQKWNQGLNKSVILYWFKDSLFSNVIHPKNQVPLNHSSVARREAPQLLLCSQHWDNISRAGSW